MKAIVVIPTYNEAENIVSLIPKVLTQHPQLEVLVVDDNSPDGTGQLVDDIATCNPRVHILHRQEKAGLGPAYVAGFRWALDAGADLVLEMDADHSHDPAALPSILEASERADLVLGSRNIAGGKTVNWPWYRTVISRGGSLYARTILGISVKDVTGGFKCFHREVLEAINLEKLQANGYGFQIELTYLAIKAGFSVAEVPITFADREVGQSKMSSGIVLEAMQMVWQLRLRPHQGALHRNKGATQSKRPLRVLQVISEAPPIQSGVAKVALELQNGLAGRNYQVDILSSVDIPRHNFGEFRLSTFIFHWRRLRKQMLTYDLINIHAPAPTFTDLYLVLASRFGFSPRKQRIILTYHSEIDLPGRVVQPMSRLYSWIHKKIAGWMAGHTVVSSPSYAELLAPHVTPERLTTIPWGVDGAAFTPSDESDGVISNLDKRGLRVVFVGQMRPYKGLDVLLRAMTHLPGVQLRVIGGGHHEQAFRQLATDLNLRNVDFLGRVSDADLSAVLRTSDVLVLPSLTMAEAFGIVLLEAMAAGCVPIASNIPGVRDVVGQVGYTFPIGDHQALAARLAYLRDHPDAVKWHASMALAKAKRFSWHRSVQAYDQLYRAILTEVVVQQGHASEQNIAIVAMKSFAQHLQAEMCALYDYMPADQTLVRRLAWGANMTWPTKVGYTEGVLGFAYQQHRTLLLPDDIAGTYFAHERAIFNKQSALITTIAQAEGQVSVLCFARPDGALPLTFADQDWLTSTIRSRLSNIQTAPLPVAQLPTQIQDKTASDSHQSSPVQSVS
ncbi:MAG: glycosyltransferase [Chloroflexota bacterium]